jgi:hypothetical protein
LTDVGYAALETAAPGHVEAVRSHMIDQLSPDQICQLAAIGQAIVDGLEAEATADCPDEGAASSASRSTR